MAEGDKKDQQGKDPSSSWDVILLLFVMIKNARKWWLIPLLIVLAFLSIFVRLSGNSSVLPAIYALF